jgi:hypothetical protein
MTYAKAIVNVIISDMNTRELPQSDFFSILDSYAQTGELPADVLRIVNEQLFSYVIASTTGRGSGLSNSLNKDLAALLGLKDGSEGSDAMHSLLVISDIFNKYNQPQPYVAGLNVNAPYLYAGSLEPFLRLAQEKGFHNIVQLGSLGPVNFRQMNAMAQKFAMPVKVWDRRQILGVVEDDLELLDFMQSVAPELLQAEGTVFVGDNTFKTTEISQAEKEQFAYNMAIAIAAGNIAYFYDGQEKNLQKLASLIELQWIRKQVPYELRAVCTPIFATSMMGMQMVLADQPLPSVKIGASGHVMHYCLELNRKEPK